MLIGVIAGVLGYIGGYFSSLELLSRIDIEGAGHVVFSPSLLAISTLFVALLSILSASLPALKATKIQPTDVFSQI